MDLYVYPFTQIYEDCMLEMRESSTETKTKSKYKRRVNHIYQMDLPARFEWDWLRKTGTIQLEDDYTTGTIAVAAAGTTVTGTSTVWTSANSNGHKMKISGNDQIYTCTFSSATSLTISPAFTGETAETAATYTLYQDTYELPADFGRWPVTGARVYQYIGGTRRVVDWAGDDEFRRHYTYQPSGYVRKWREVQRTSSGTTIGTYNIEITPPCNTTGLLQLEYTKALPAMVEWTDTAKTGTTTTKLLTTNNMYGKAVAGMYVRKDPTNFGEWAEWVKITAVAADTTTGDGITVATFTTAPTNTDAITICSAPDMPYTFQKALFHGACMLTGLEQNDEASQGYATAYANAIDADMARKSRKRYGKRRMGVGNWR